MYGLTLEQAPPYKVPLFYYLAGVVYLLVLSLLLVFLYVKSRYDEQAIAMTHILTLGFFTHVMMGTLFQMVPVIIAEVYRNVQFFSKLLFVGLNLGIISFALYLLGADPFFGVFGAASVIVSVLFFSLYSLQTVLKTEDKNPFVKTIASALFFLSLGAILGGVSLLQYSGKIGGVWLGELHIKIMIFGWVFLLFSGVSYKILSMFYVAKEYPLMIKNHLYSVVSAVLILSIFAIFLEAEFIQTLLSIALACVSGFFAFLTIVILKQRKRARTDVTVNFFYFAMGNLLIGSLLWVIALAFDLHLDIVLGIIFGLGFVYGIINAMLYKIIPFLTWFHLSSSFVYEAEMGKVIELKKMKIQFYLFVCSYALFLLSSLWSVLVMPAASIFLLSSLLLAFNVMSGYLYYQKMIIKAIKYD
jgi:hypothetical protein